MANQLSSNITTKTTPARCDVVNARWRGWNDAAAGLGYAADYDSLDPFEQRAYERGRLLAVAVRAAGGALPKWKRNETAHNMARRIIGDAPRAAYRDEITFTAPR